MNFSFSSDQQLLKNSARAFLDEHMKPATVRLLWDDPRGESEALWKEMGELGWLGLSLPEAHGGSGLGMVETAILLEEMGHAALPGPYLPTVLAARAIEEAGTNAQRMRWLSAIATGAARATLALLDADLDWRPEGTRTRAEKSATGPGHGRRLREGARAVRAAGRLLPGDPPQVRRDAPGGRELARRRLLLRVGPRREGGGRGARGVGRQGVCRRRRAPCLRRGDPGARRHRVHLGVRPAPLLQARESARGDVRGRRPPPRADRPAGRRVGRGRHAPLPVAAQGPPLDGIRVVDLTSYIAGSYAAMQLADMGADVVKVESPEGDAFRELPGFFGWNRGKRSISVDLKTPEGRAIVERLATG